MPSLRVLAMQTSLFECPSKRAEHNSISPIGWFFVGFCMLGTVCCGLIARETPKAPQTKAPTQTPKFLLKASSHCMSKTCNGGPGTGAGQGRGRNIHMGALHCIFAFLSWRNTLQAFWWSCVCDVRTPLPKLSHLTGLRETHAILPLLSVFGAVGGAVRLCVAVEDFFPTPSTMPDELICMWHLFQKAPHAPSI